ncbi:MAG: hypothetical protein ACLPID_17435 [Beijerinckiaceae bacterium]
MQTRLLLTPLAGFAREIGAVSRRRGARGLLAVLVFCLTFIGGLTFLDLVVDSHVYHAFLESIFFAPKRSAKTFNAELMHANWHVSLTAADLRKIGHTVDSFERSLFKSLVARLHDISIMKQGDERLQATAGFAARVDAHRADIKRTMHEIQAMRDSGLEGLAIEFGDINMSLDRLKQVNDVLSVAAAELQAGPDQVTLHGIQKQFDGLLKALDTKPPSTAARSN